MIALATRDTIFLKFASKARADWRAPTCAALIGSGVGLALGAAYMAGGMARAASDHTRAARIAEATEGGFAEDVLLRQAAFDPGAARIARRQDPLAFAGSSEPDRQATLVAARLEDVSKAIPPLRVQTIGLPAAAPFKLAGALESSRELECLTQAVYFEARGETPAGQAAVAQVVLNRVRHPAFPKSVCGVVFQGSGKRVGCQFSFACNGSMHARRESAAWDRARRVASRALGGFVMSTVGDSTHFHTLNVAPNWGPRLVRTAEVGMHVFYKFGRSAPKAEERVYYASLATPAAPKVEVSPDLHAAVMKAPESAIAVAEAKPALAEAAKLAPKAAVKLTPVANPGLKPVVAQPQSEVAEAIVGDD
jgi:spore germination cell wall hydrolase CwlJ-like protein